MIPDKSEPKPPPVESWEAGADDRDIDKYFHWKFYTEAEDRSLDRMIEMMRRDRAAARAILDMKTRLICAGLRIRLTSKEHAMVAAEFEGWSRAETDPEKDARLASLGRLSRHICAAAEREEAEKAKRPARKRRRDPKPR